MSKPETTVLEKISLFRELDEARLEQVAAICRKKSFRDGSVIIREGDRGDEMFVVMEGEVGISRRIETELPGGRKVSFEKKLAVLGPGAYFGEVAVLENDVRSATVRAETPIRALVIKKDRIQELMENDQVLGYYVLKAMSRVLCERLRKADMDITKLLTAFAMAVRR